jgi:hypothetical protein
VYKVVPAYEKTLAVSPLLDDDNLLKEDGVDEVFDDEVLVGIAVAELELDVALDEEVDVDVDEDEDDVELVEDDVELDEDDAVVLGDAEVVGATYDEEVVSAFCSGSSSPIFADSSSLPSLSLESIVMSPTFEPSLLNTTTVAVDPFGIPTTQKCAPPAPAGLFWDTSLTAIVFGSISQGRPTQGPSHYPDG